MTRRVLPGKRDQRTYRRAMRELRLVGPSDDADHLVLEADDERFLLRADAALRAAVLAPAGAPAPSTASAPAAAAPVERRTDLPVGPREIQVRVRAGESPEDIAASYDVPVERIARFAAPVLEERLRITDEARRARARRTGRDGADALVVVFGETVDGRYAAHGILPTDVTWDSRRREDGEWIVVARWTGGGGEHAAEWSFNRTSRFVTPLDDTAGDLLSDRPIRPVVPPQPEPPRASLIDAPPLRPGVVAFPPMPDAHTGPVPRVRDDVFDQDATVDGPRDLPAFARHEPVEQARPEISLTTPTGPTVPPLAAPVHIDEPSPFEFDEPALPLNLGDDVPRPISGLGKLRNLGAAKREESDEEKAARARIPSWDDILLGVRRKD